MFTQPSSESRSWRSRLARWRSKMAQIFLEPASVTVLCLDGDEVERLVRSGAPQNERAA